MKNNLVDKLRNFIAVGLTGLSLVASGESPYSKLSAKDAIKQVNTYEQVSEYISGLRSEEIPNTDGVNEATFNQIHSEQRGVCRDATTAAMALLSDNTNNYAVIPMSFDVKLFSKKNYAGHDVAIVYDKLAGKFGSVGIHCFEHIRPHYSTVGEVVDKLFGKKVSRDVLENIKVRKQELKKQIQEYATASKDYSKLLEEYDSLMDIIVPGGSYEESDFELCKNSGRVRPLSPDRMNYPIERIIGYTHNYRDFASDENVEEFVQKNSDKSGYQLAFGLRRLTKDHPYGELLKGGELK